MDKNFKIFGVSYGLIGDLVMGLPCLTYLEKKYPGSYKIWAIEKKVSHCAPIFFNHPLIDKVHIMGENTIGLKDDYSKYDFACSHPFLPWKHSSKDWVNHKSCVEETAWIAGIKDLKEVLTEEEMIPKLYRWFYPGGENKQTYLNPIVEFNESVDVAIWPYAGRERSGESPTEEWWMEYIKEMMLIGVRAIMFGKENPMPYFHQVKMALNCKLAIGPDTGAMWVMAAYDLPCINLMTNWLMNHTQNHLALAPVGINTHNLFVEGGVANITVEEAVQKTLEIL